ncbi:hypothetical protein SAMN05720758_3111 [Fibrobacter sp. UWB11]|nr:hypothetical protein SAMN05720758_3111 [Fibrobacter sp. UWB11]
MEKSQKINLAIFLAFIAVTVLLSYVLGTDFMGKQEKPWHMQGAVHEDSLSQEYLSKYKILDKVPVTLQIENSKEKRVLILIDAWGVPFDEQKLAKEFAIFKDVPHKFAFHKRLKNVTKHAELVEFRTDSLDSIFVIDKLSSLDSLLRNSGYKTIALTINDSKEGSEESLHKVLNEIAGLIENFPDVQFIVQGAHRPILGTPETRRQYYAHWVPVVILN